VSQAPGFTRAHRLLLWLYRRLLSDPQQAAEQQARLAMARRRRRSASPAAGPGPQAADRPSSTGPATAAAAAEAGQRGDAAGRFDDQDCIVVVSGLPRSGTAMMMQMLAAGGLPLLTDGRREADASNPRGYHELEAATRLRSDRAWLADARNKGVKIVAQLLPFLPAGHSYRVILMERALEEVLASQRRMLARSPISAYSGSTMPRSLPSRDGPAPVSRPSSAAAWTAMRWPTRWMPGSIANGKPSGRPAARHRIRPDEGRCDAHRDGRSPDCSANRRVGLGTLRRAEYCRPGWGTTAAVLPGLATGRCAPEDTHRRWSCVASRMM
jgi:hypothetical protein